MGGVAKKGGERFLALLVLVLSEEQGPSFADDCLGVAPTKRKGEKRWGEGDLNPVCLLRGMAVSAEATKAFSRNGRTQRAPGWPSRETVTLMLGNFPGSSWPFRFTFSSSPFCSQTLHMRVQSKGERLPSLAWEAVFPELWAEEWG